MFRQTHLRTSFKTVFAVLLVALASPVAAQVTLENTIKKVETFINQQGEVEHRLVSAESVVPGDELKYVVSFTNQGSQPVDAGTIVITDRIPEHTEYVAGTAFGVGTQVAYSLDGQTFAAPDLLLAADEQVAEAGDYSAIRWTFAPELKPGETGRVSFNVRLK